jgi:hypothetical protein
MTAIHVSIFVVRGLVNEKDHSAWVKTPNPLTEGLSPLAYATDQSRAKRVIELAFDPKRVQPSAS